MRKKSPQVKDQGISIVNDVDTWLRLSGFDFNPFTALDAATDQHLHRYLVQHEVFKLIWPSVCRFSKTVTLVRKRIVRSRFRTCRLT